MLTFLSEVVNNLDVALAWRQGEWGTDREEESNMEGGVGSAYPLFPLE